MCDRPIRPKPGSSAGLPTSNSHAKRQQLAVLSPCNRFGTNQNGCAESFGSQGRLCSGDGRPNGSGLSCIRAAEDAGQLGTACATFQQPTAGSYEYPENKWHLAKRIFWCDLQHVEYCKKESTVAYMLSKPR